MPHVGDRFPYNVPFGFSDHRNDTFSVRQRVFYCPACEEASDRAFAKYYKMTAK